MNIQQNKIISKTDIFTALRQVIEPSYNINVVDLGLILDVRMKTNLVVHVAFTLINLNQTEVLWVNKMQQCLERIPGIGGVDLELVAEPAWSISKITKEGAKQVGLIFSGGTHE